MKINKEYKKRIISWAIVIILLIIACFYYKDTVSEIVQGIKELEGYKILICCLVGAMSFLAEGFVIYNMSKHINPDFKWRNGFAISFFCEFFRVLTLGSGAGFAEIFYLQKKKIPPAKGTGITFMQYGAKKIAIMLCGVVGFFALRFNEEVYSVLRSRELLMGLGAFFTVFVAFFMMGLTFSKKLNLFLNWLFDKLSAKFPGRQKWFDDWRVHANQLNETGLFIIHYPSIIVGNVLVCMVKLFAIYCIPAYVLIGNCSISMFNSVMLMCVIGMVDIIIPIPSGVGSFEFLSALFFTGFADTADSLGAILLYRFATWIVPFFVGMILWILDQKNTSKGQSS